MAFWRFRNRAIFRATARPLDPDELKLRARQRMVAVSAIICICLLAVPVVREQMPGFATDREARLLLSEVRQARLVAASSRTPAAVSFQRPDGIQVLTFPGQENCANLAAAKEEFFRPLPEIGVKPLYLEAGNNSGLGKELKIVCFHPLHGALAEQMPIGDGWIYLVLGPKSEFAAQNLRHAKQVVISKFGQVLGLQALVP